MRKNLPAVQEGKALAVELALIANDLSMLTPEERVYHHDRLCKSLGLNPLTQPFGYIAFQNGKVSLYAKKDCTEQLRKIHKVSIKIVKRETENGVHVVTAQATDKDGRSDEACGAVFISHLKGIDLANAFMKAETKAKRRVTLSICGLGFLDESEVETVEGARVVSENYSAGNSLGPAITHGSPADDDEIPEEFLRSIQEWKNG